MQYQMMAISAQIAHNALFTHSNPTCNRWKAIAFNFVPPSHD